MGNKPNCPPPTVCPTCAICPSCPQQKEQHHNNDNNIGKNQNINSNIIGQLINNYITGFYANDRTLGQYEKCNLGTLKNIQLCNIVEFDVPTKVSCDLKITLHNLKGAEQIHISKLDFEHVVNSNVFELILEITFGQLTGNLSMIPTKANCGWTGKLTSRAVTCVKENIIIGSIERPAKLKLRMQIPFECTHPTEAKIVALEIDLGKLTVTCFKILDWLPTFVQTTILTNLSNQVSLFLKKFLDDMIKSVFLKTLPWCSPIH